MTDCPPARVRVLGPVEVDDVRGSAVTTLGTNTRAMVAALAVNAPAAVSTAVLAESVWGADGPRNPKASVQSLVSRLRAAAGADLVRSVPGGYVLSAPSDLDRVREALAPGGEDATADRCAELDALSSLWRGPVGADLGGASVADELAEASNALSERLQRMLADALTDAGEHARAARVLSRLAEVAPFDETIHARLMTALAEDGRVGEALAVFARVRARLRESLGADPGTELSDVNARLLRRAPAPATAPVRIGLRAAPNELIGRDDEVSAIARALERSRLVTVLGPGGLGKTRIAQAVAAASSAPTVVFVPLAGVREDGDVATAIAATLGISEAGPGGRLTDVSARPDLRARVIAMLEAAPTLIVLDNCEQVIDGVARWSADVLAAAASVRVLATSRAPLAVAGEVVFPLTALPVGQGADGPAVRLFRERARAVRPQVALPAEVVARVCEHLDGLPLAIELAAARVRTMTLAQIEQGLTDRFALLVGRDRSAPRRHRTLHAVIGWSWELLDAEAAHALAVLSVLPAGFTLQTADAMLGAPAADGIEQLVSQSLLVAFEDPLIDAMRFRMLETVREYALERLESVDEGVDAAWRRARGWARAFCAARARTALEVPVHTQLRAEHDNLVAVLRRALEDGRAAREDDGVGAAEADTDAVVVFAALVQMWMVRGAFSEVETFITDVIAVAVRAAGDVPADALCVVLMLGTLMARFDVVPRGVRAAARLRRLRRAGLPEDPVLAALADVALAGDVAAATERIDRLCEHEDPRLRLIGESARANLAENEGRLEEGMTAAARAWQLAGRTGDVWVGAMAASSAAQLSSQLGRPAQALDWLDRAAQAFAGYGIEEQARQQDWLRAMNLIEAGDRDRARAIFRDLQEVREATEEGVELAAVGVFGTAELDRIDGDVHAAADGYREAIARFGHGRARNSPWYLMVLAGAVAALAVDGSGRPGEAAAWARRLRTRTLAVHRTRVGFVDRPVLGTVLAGWSAWAVTDPHTRGRGVRALATATRLGGRQDLPSLNHQALRAHASAWAGPDVLEQAGAEASTLDDDAALSMALDLLRG